MPTPTPSFRSIALSVAGSIPNKTPGTAWPLPFSMMSAAPPSTPRKVMKFHRKVWQPAGSSQPSHREAHFFVHTIFPIGPVEVRTISKVECRAAFHELIKRQAYFNTEVNPKCTVQDFPVRS